MQDYWWNLEKPKKKEQSIEIEFKEDGVWLKSYNYHRLSYAEAEQVFEAFKNLKAEKQNAITRKIKELESKR